jgi:PIN domain nuclease of toxin-antitoxin system
LSDPNARLLLSVIVLWEIQIKVQTGKLALTYPLSDLARIQERDNRIAVLPVTSAHVLALDGLPFLHKDPFDRLLIAQTQVEGATLLTADASIAAYPISTLW